MSEPTEPSAADSVPAEVPEEFAAAYRAAYEQAMAQQSVPTSQSRPGSHAARDDEGTMVPERTRTIRVGTHREERESPGPEDTRTRYERLRDSGWLVPVLLVALVLILVLGAYVVGRIVAGELGHGTGASEEPHVVMQEHGSSGERQPVSQQRPGTGAWSGKVSPVAGVHAKAGCTLSPSVDAAGKRVTYGADKLVDGAADTAWRCDGSATGQRITLDLGAEVPVGEVGMIPGYAKTDEQDGTDRYAENDRVTRVRWTIGDRQVVQSLAPDPRDRSVRTLRVPRTKASTVTLEILSVAKGSRDTTAISEVEIGRAG